VTGARTYGHQAIAYVALCACIADASCDSSGSKVFYI